jgi:transmembrane sensor
MQRSENEHFENLIAGYLKGELNRDETNELISWINSSSRNKQYYDQCCEVWIIARSLSGNRNYNVQKAFWKFKQNIKTGAVQNTGMDKIRFLKSFVRYAAIIILAFTAGGYLFNINDTILKSDRKKTVTNELIIPLGSHASLTLPDGTEVTLNAGSIFKFDGMNKKNERIVQLEGEAYFKVAKDTKRPFIVNTTCLNVIALGTEFNVKAYPLDKTVETTLVSGSVKIEAVSLSDSVTILKPNQKYTFFRPDPVTTADTASGEAKTDIQAVPIQKASNVQDLVKEDVNIESIISWKENIWIFEQQSLAQLAVELERKFDVKIVFDSENLKSLRFTGTISAEPIEQVLEVISISAPINFNLKGRVVTLSENKKFKERNKELYN